MKRLATALLLVLAVLLSLLGVAAFAYLFAPIFNIYWFILAPIILALYQLPAVYVFLLWKRRARAENGPPGRGPEARDEEKNAPDGI
jgi:hypothetical protein